MFTLRRQLTALTIVAATAFSASAMAAPSPQEQLQNYLTNMVSQQMTAVKTEIMSEVTQVIAQTTYQAEPDMNNATLVAKTSIRDLNTAEQHAADEKGE